MSGMLLYAIELHKIQKWQNMLELSNWKNTEIAELCICWCYQSFNISKARNEQRKTKYQVYFVNYERTPCGLFTTITARNESNRADVGYC